MNRVVRIGLILGLLLLISTTAFADSGSSTYGLFVPDITEFQFADNVETTDLTESLLPELQPYWTDLVNTENLASGGEGVYVAILDTGLHPAWPFFFSQANIAWELGIGFSHDAIGVTGTTPLDCEIELGDLRNDRGFVTDMASAHGTHVTSTVVGFNYNDLFWLNGIAPEAKIIPVLVLDAWEQPLPGGEVCQESGGTDEMVAAGIDYIADLAPTLDGPVVINMSLGGPEKSPMIEAAVDRAIANGVIVVASAGNEGLTGMGYPGGLEQIISAGAAGWASMFNYGWVGDVPEKLNKKDDLGNNWQIYLEDFSSRPNKDLDQKHQDLDVTAPGAWIVGPYKPAFTNALGYYYVSGTSMAAPHVTGIAALVLEEHPDIAQADMEFILQKAAAGLPLPASDAVVAFPFISEGYYIVYWDGGDYGSGFLQADLALQKADIFDK